MTGPKLGSSATVVVAVSASLGADHWSVEAVVLGRVGVAGLVVGVLRSMVLEVRRVLDMLLVAVVGVILVGHG